MTFPTKWKNKKNVPVTTNQIRSWCSGQGWSFPPFGDFRGLAASTETLGALRSISKNQHWQQRIEFTCLIVEIVSNHPIIIRIKPYKPILNHIKPWFSFSFPMVCLWNQAWRQKPDHITEWHVRNPMGAAALCQHLCIHCHDFFRVLESSHFLETKKGNLRMSVILWVSLCWASKPAEIEENPRMWKKKRRFHIHKPKVVSPH